MGYNKDIYRHLCTAAQNRQKEFKLYVTLLIICQFCCKISVSNSEAKGKKKSSVFKTVLKGYMMKKGHKRKNWTERWFVLRPNSLSYYVSEDLLEKRGDIILDQIHCVEVNSVQPFVV